MAKAVISKENYTTPVELTDFRVITDEPKELGGQNAGPTPTELLDAALASCTAITIKMYADRKQWDLGHFSVSVEHKKDNQQTKFYLVLGATAKLTQEQKERISIIAGKCPVHKLLDQNEMAITWG